MRSVVAVRERVPRSMRRRWVRGSRLSLRRNASPGRGGMCELRRGCRAESPPFAISVLELAKMTVLQVADVGFGYGQNRLFEGVTFSLSRGERAALVAPNGAGK